jgi:O-antigen ligase
VQPINSTGSLADYVTPTLKATTAIAALAVACLSLAVRRTRVTLGRQYVVAIALVALYLTWVIGVGLAFYHLPVQRHELALQAAFVVAVCVVLDRLRLGGMFVASYWASVALLVIGIGSGASTPWQDGSDRASAGMHPITLGLTAAFVLISSLIMLRRDRSRRFLCLAVCALAVTALFLSFSRTALVLTALALFVLWMAKIDRFTIARYLLGLWCAIAAAVLIPGKIIDFLAQGDPQNLASGTGRTVIWARVWDFRPDFQLHGYGFAALNDMGGPDLALLTANRGENAENALLQAFVMGGYVGAALWLLAIGYIVVFCLRAGRPRGEMVALLVTVLGGGLTVHSLSGFGHPWTLLLALLSFALARRRQSIE